ncbi:type II toxin-antitoxin system VapC family toxin [Microbacterium sp. A93]|uniref:type II toxin-antitoxin system VapC family toxin n=1 Tax=Microbacterium sp. A93 TaxID=3450716 RepID=UPI003F42F9D0
MVTAVVLDASAAIDASLGRGTWPVPDSLHTHAGLDIEVMAMLRRKVLRNELSASFARESIDVFASLDVERHPLTHLLSRIWALRHDISAYDAGYVALAEALGIPLLTLDRNLARTAQRYCDVITP